jgi:hypothetical protein
MYEKTKWSKTYFRRAIPDETAKHLGIDTISAYSIASLLLMQKATTAFGLRAKTRLRSGAGTQGGYADHASRVGQYFWSPGRLKEIEHNRPVVEMFGVQASCE